MRHFLFPHSPLLWPTSSLTVVLPLILGVKFDAVTQWFFDPFRIRLSFRLCHDEGGFLPISLNLLAQHWGFSDCFIRQHVSNCPSHRGAPYAGFASRARIPLPCLANCSASRFPFHPLRAAISDDPSVSPRSFAQFFFLLESDALPPALNLL